MCDSFSGLTHNSAQNLFDEVFYQDLDGGILEAFGRLLKHNVRIYVYPSLDAHTGELVTVDNLQVTSTSAIQSTSTKHLQDGRGTRCPATGQPQQACSTDPSSELAGCGDRPSAEPFCGWLSACTAAWLQPAISCCAAVQVDPAVQKLFDYIVSRGTVVPITDFNRDYLSRGDVTKRVQVGYLLLKECSPHASLVGSWRSSSLTLSARRSGVWACRDAASDELSHPAAHLLMSCKGAYAWAPRSGRSSFPTLSARRSNAWAHGAGASDELNQSIAYLRVSHRRAYAWRPRSGRSLCPTQ